LQKAAVAAAVAIKNITPKEKILLMVHMFQINDQFSLDYLTGLQGLTGGVRIGLQASKQQ
jgi:hypothetical protein